MKLINKLERKIGKFAIPNLMLAIVMGMFIVYIITLTFPQIGLWNYLYFDRKLVFSGEVWRLISFIILPPQSSIIFIILSLYFYYMIGSALENEWGSFKFNVYYLFGIIGTIIAGLITGFAQNSFLNLSLFLAFAVLYPNYEILLFFFIPIKVKYLAYLDAIYFIIILIIGSWDSKAAVLASLINFFLFFGGDFIRYIKEEKSYLKTRRNFKKVMKNK